MSANWACERKITTFSRLAAAAAATAAAALILTIGARVYLLNSSNKFRICASQARPTATCSHSLNPFQTLTYTHTHTIAALLLRSHPLSDQVNKNCAQHSHSQLHVIGRRRCRRRRHRRCRCCCLFVCFWRIKFHDAIIAYCNGRTSQLCCCCCYFKRSFAQIGAGELSFCIHKL